MAPGFAWKKHRHIFLVYHHQLHKSSSLIKPPWSLDDGGLNMAPEGSAAGTEVRWYWVLLMVDTCLKGIVTAAPYFTGTELNMGLKSKIEQVRARRIWGPLGLWPKCNVSFFFINFCVLLAVCAGAPSCWSTTFPSRILSFTQGMNPFYKQQRPRCSVSTVVFRRKII